MDNDKKQHEFTIIVNARKKTVTTSDLAFEQIVALAFENPPGGDVLFTVTFKNADGSSGKKSEGTLEAGQSVTVKNGTIFDVTATNKS